MLPPPSVWFLWGWCVGPQGRGGGKVGCEDLILLLSPAGVRAGEIPGGGERRGGGGGGTESPPTHPKAHWLVFESSLSSSLLCFLMIHFLPNATHAFRWSLLPKDPPPPTFSTGLDSHLCMQAFPALVHAGLSFRSVWEPRP